jgi:hypothetical protein
MGKFGNLSSTAQRKKGEKLLGRMRDHLSGFNANRIQQLTSQIEFSDILTEMGIASGREINANGVADPGDFVTALDTAHSAVAT